jgi:photosystem II stability/assembly factor-like uncharacterized protein
MKKLLLIFLFLGLTVQAQIPSTTPFWTEYSTGHPAASTNVESISIVDANVVWTSNDCGTTGCTPIRRWGRSVDSGLTWANGVIDLGVNSAGLNVANLTAASATTAWVTAFPIAAGAAGMGVYKTTDSGATWTRQATAVYSDPDSFPDITHFWDANNGVTIGDPVGGYLEIYTTTDGGTNWVRTPSANIPAPIAGEFAYTNLFNVTGNVIWFGTNKPWLYRSTDKGLTWTKHAAPPAITDWGNTAGGSMAFTDANNGLALTRGWELFATTNGGASWGPSLAFNGSIGSFGIANIPGHPNAYVTVGVDPILDPARGSYWSVNGGLDWIDINDNPDTNYVDGGEVSFFSPTVGFAGGFTTSTTVGGIFKWNGVLLANTQFSNDKLFSVSPNPTSGTFSLNGVNINQVQVTDVLGKVIFNNNYSSLSNVELNITDYNTGIYFVKATNDLGNSSIVKVIKE